MLWYFCRDWQTVKIFWQNLIPKKSNNNGRKKKIKNGKMIKYCKMNKSTPHHTSVDNHQAWQHVTSPLSVKPVVYVEPPSLVSRVIQIVLISVYICSAHVSVIWLCHNSEIFLITNTKQILTKQEVKIIFFFINDICIHSFYPDTILPGYFLSGCHFACIQFWSACLDQLRVHSFMMSAFFWTF